MNKLSQALYRLSSGPVTLAALTVFILFMVFILPGQARKADAVAGGAGSPDTSYFYSSADLNRMAEVYGEEGRTAYVYARFTFDLVVPVVYLAFLATSISWLLNKAIPDPGNKWRLLNLFPVFGAFFDYGENVAASVFMMTYPSPSALAGVLAPVFTPVKWFFVNGSFVVLLIAGVLALWKGRRQV